VMCIVCIGMVLLSQPNLALISFILSLLLMLASLALSLREILISYRALEMHLADIEELHRED